MGSLNQLAEALGGASGIAVKAVCLVSTLAILGALAGPAWSLTLSLVGICQHVLEERGTELLIALGLLALVKYNAS